MSRAGWTLTIVCAATALLLLDVTVVNVALPVIAADLEADFAAVQWVIDAYALTLAALLLTAGTLADRNGRRRVFVTGTAIFTVASGLCAAAYDGTSLDLARALQGVGAAAMFATALPMLAVEFEGAARGRALGIWGAVSGAALALGPVVGGALVDGPGWRWIFLVNLPLGVAVAVLARNRVAETSDPAAPPPDWAGASLFSGALFLLVLGLIRGNPDGWSSALVVGALALGSALLVAFVAVQRRSAAPMLDPALMRRRSLSGTAIAAFGQSVAIYPLFLFIAIYLQSVLGYTALETGVRLLPLTAALLAVAPLSGRLTTRLGPTTPLAAGLLVLAVALWLMRAIAPGEDWDAMLPGMLAGGVAIGLISPALAGAIAQALPIAQSGAASGIANTFRQTGIAAGIAVFGAMFHHALGDALPGPQTADQVVDGLRAVFTAAAAVSVATAVATLLVLRQPVASMQAESP